MTLLRPFIFFYITMVHESFPQTFVTVNKDILKVYTRLSTGRKNLWIKPKKKGFLYLVVDKREKNSFDIPRFGILMHNYSEILTPVF